MTPELGCFILVLIFGSAIAIGILAGGFQTRCPVCRRLFAREKERSEEQSLGNQVRNERRKQLQAIVTRTVHQKDQDPPGFKSVFERPLERGMVPASEETVHVFKTWRITEERYSVTVHYRCKHDPKHTWSRKLDPETRLIDEHPID